MNYDSLDINMNLNKPNNIYSQQECVLLRCTSQI